MFGMLTESGEEAAVEVVSSKTVMGVSGGKAPTSKAFLFMLIVLVVERAIDRVDCPEPDRNVPDCVKPV
jgi:hypothetical protein